MNKKLKFLQLIILVIISGLAGYYVGISSIKLSWDNYKPSLHVVNKEVPGKIANVDFSVFWNVWQKLETGYYDKTKLDPQKMLNGAIEGMTQSLGDPYTMYLPPVQNTSFKEGLAGEFSGIGAELGTRNKQIIVIAPLSGSPAEKAGIKSGDTIFKVNGEVTTNWTVSSAVEKIRGPKGTIVNLTIVPQNSNKPQDVKIVRDTIKVKSVEGWMKNVKDIERIKISKDMEGKIAYVRLSQFGDSTNEDWIAIVNKFDSEIHNNKDVKGLIIDLRNNPGGYLSDAVFISSEFLKKGLPVVIEDNGQGVQNTQYVSRQGLLHDVPVVILINKGSASASEIVSGALRDNKRAILVGETSFGKGTIQQSDDLGGGAGLHITIAKWLTPNGTWVHDKGLKPDIEVKANLDDEANDAQLERAVKELLK